MSLSRSGIRWNPGRGNYVNHLSSVDDYGRQGDWLTRVRNEVQPDDSTTAPYTPLAPGSTSGSLSDVGLVRWIMKLLRIPIMLDSLLMLMIPIKSWLMWLRDSMSGIYGIFVILKTH